VTEAEAALHSDHTGKATRWWPAAHDLVLAFAIISGAADQLALILTARSSSAASSSSP
jgi:hypothetical protein